MFGVRKRSAIVTVVSALALAAGITPAQAAHSEQRIVLEGASSAEGIAAGAGTTFYAGDLFLGDIYRGNIRTGTASLFIDAPAGRMAVGMTADVSRGLLFVAGGTSGTAYVYDISAGTSVASVPLAAGSSFINDVTLTPDGAWFTDSVAPKLYFLPVSASGALGPVRTLSLTGPAGAIAGDFNNNGIAATADGSTLLVAHSALGVVNTVDPVTGQSATIAGVSVPAVDGIQLTGRTLYAVQNSNQVTAVQLSGDLTSGTVKRVITSADDLLQTSTTMARFGDRIAVVNAKFDTGFPPTADEYDVTVLDR